MQAALNEEDQQSWRKQQNMQAELDKRIKKLFQQIDQDGNGLVDRLEFAVAMNVLDIPGTVEDHDALFEAWDADGSGGIGLKEIRQALIALQKEGGDDMQLKAAAALLDDL